MTFLPEFRSLFYKRVGYISYLLRVFCKPMDTLYINTDADNIGEGLFIQHGFSTVIAAKSIGKNCWINQQVTIGYTNDTDCPVIGDHVSIGAGAIILGDVKIGSHSKIGAGAVVTKDVPEHCTVVGGKSRIVRRNGVRVDELL